MDMLPVERETVTIEETALERERRLRWEAAEVAKAMAEFEAGFYVDGGEMSAWISSIGTDDELPLPPVRRR